MSGEWRSGSDGRAGTMVFGLLLISIGLAFFAGQFVNLDWAEAGWPLFVIVPGLVLFVGGLAIRSDGGLGMAIPGAIVTTVGLILALQQATGAWASWAYMWALVAPGSVGVALAAHGLLHGRRDNVDAGLRTMAVGLGLFVGFGLFFENLIGIDREASTTILRDAMPVVAVALGAVIVVISLLPRRATPAATPANQWTAGWSEPPAGAAPEPPAPPRPPVPPAGPAS